MKLNIILTIEEGTEEIRSSVNLNGKIYTEIKANTIESALKMIPDAVQDPEQGEVKPLKAEEEDNIQELDEFKESKRGKTFIFNIAKGRGLISGRHARDLSLKELKYLHNAGRGDISREIYEAYFVGVCRGYEAGKRKIKNEKI